MNEELPVPSPTQRPQRGYFRELLGKIEIGPEHIERALNSLNRIFEARMQAGLAEVAATQEIRGLKAQLDDATIRCERAADLLDRYSEFLSDKERGELASAIIMKQLGSKSGR